MTPPDRPVAIGASAAAVLGGAAAWREDFRADLAAITVPVLVVQGGQDWVMPPRDTGNRLPGLLARPWHVVIPDGPHAIIWTHADEVNRALLDFIGALLPAGDECSQHADTPPSLRQASLGLTNRCPPPGKETTE